MSNPERRTLLRFILVYMGMFFLLFASISYLYYHEQRHVLRDRFEAEMRKIAVSAFADPEAKLPEGFRIVPVLGTNYPPNILVLEPDRFVLRIPLSRSSGRSLAVTADPGLYEAAETKLRLRILAFMLLAFFVNLPIAYLLARISLRPYRQANERLKEFARDILHDLNAPLTALGINLEALAAECPSKRLRLVEFSFKQIRTLYQNLELYLRDEYRSEAKRVDLDRLVSEIVAPLREQYPEAKFRVEISPLTVEINPVALERVVGNLVQNALKYAGPRATITLGLDERKRFFVRDDGPGMENPERFLQRGKQAHPTNPGQGLGLDIVRKLGESCRLPLQIRSEPGRGTAFYFDLSDRIVSPNREE